jgi:SNF2 family DNA or RNA helicase
MRAGMFHTVQLIMSTSLITLRYLHAVTKARNRILASETGGGILADEMGMGKSLSTLALITKTLDKAYDWVMEKKANPENRNRQKACRATLILVPSASKSLSGFQVIFGNY